MNTAWLSTELCRTKFACRSAFQLYYAVISYSYMALSTKRSGSHFSSNFFDLTRAFLLSVNCFSVFGKRNWTSSYLLCIAHLYFKFRYPQSRWSCCALCASRFHFCCLLAASNIKQCHSSSLLLCVFFSCFTACEHFINDSQFYACRFFLDPVSFFPVSSFTFIIASLLLFLLVCSLILLLVNVLLFVHKVIRPKFTVKQLSSNSNAENCTVHCFTQAANALIVFSNHYIWYNWKYILRGY